MADNLLKVRLSSPEKVIWEGQAKSVSSVNSEGPFDILPFHANFITIVENKPIQIQTVDKLLEYAFSHSLIYAKNNSVVIYSNI